ncbi:MULTISPECIES: hypothetical protein [Gluconobacter]|uniref:hypothetical protein n=1 Tax=Gluconobacter TaxID=441 RepID=UPI00157DB5ED|nr:hypothetical protein [Gluconobacter kondonii]MBS1053799.1 hypothetical protein [Gluconobacter kondonii]MBS1058023.1 hypothetical protein [Gluconobacter kondonii]MBS1092572.1 hypothetical protein [Gluconobacter sp. Dm-74]GBR36928.1 hypothetical protein AA3266_2492 [Gluconobacter kondonii NBRC 3266]
MVDALQEEKAAHVVDDIGEPDPHDGPGDTDSSDEQTHLEGSKNPLVLKPAL